jgi:hypothetical protein
MTHNATPSIALRLVAGTILLCAVKLWLASVASIFRSTYPLQFDKAGLQVVAIGPYALALAQVAFLSICPPTMQWPLSSGKLAFGFSVACSVVSLAWGIQELGSADSQQVSFWAEAPTI